MPLDNGYTIVVCNTIKGMISMGNRDYLYYIVKEPYDSKLQEFRSLPGIFRIQLKPGGDIITRIDPRDGEGPFNSLFDLKMKSFIFRNVKLQKHRDKISKSKNIETLKDGLSTEVGTSFAKSFVDSFSHIIVGKISKSKLSGIHFYDPDKIQIIEKIGINKETGVWSARIRKKNENTGEWIEKKDISNFFPVDWSIARVFKESSFAYQNKIHVSGQVYHAKTISGINVKFIIDQVNKILTFYPEID